MIEATKDAGQKEQELEWFDSFRAKCPDSPRSKPDQPSPPSPDLLFREEGLGIEITQYLLGQGKNGSHSRRLETVRGDVLQKARALYEVNFHECIHVSVHWMHDLWPEKKDYEVLAQAISRGVAKRQRDDGYCRIEWESFEEPLLQKYIFSISVAPISGGDRSSWANPIALCFGTLDYTVESFQKLINEKRGLIAGYRGSCERVWLLIVADRRWFSSSISAHEPLKGGFQIGVRPGICSGRTQRQGS